MKKTPPPEAGQVTRLAEAVLAGNRRALAKAITLIENRLPERRILANEMISTIMPRTGHAIRVGVSGVPGVGKSTFIEAFGTFLTGNKHRVAVLAVDPSSQISGGSILGDKVRMEDLARDPNAFIRPSPAAGSLGGVARRTRESMLLCEAAGFDVILVETVGVGQSEITVSEMVDFFLVLLLPNAGDEIQGIKKGIIEMADGLVVNKADNDMVRAAERTQREFHHARHLLRQKVQGWSPPVLTTSALEGKGIPEVWHMIHEHRTFLEKGNHLQALRASQLHNWFHTTVREELQDRLYGDKTIRRQMTQLEADLAAQRKSPHQCAEEIVTQFLKKET